ncbi:hypothetical protein KR026_004947, partial [Drosophila bipectinata]
IPLETAEAEALNPNHFLWSCNSSLAAKDNKNMGILLGKNYRIAGHIADKFRKRWLKEYLPSLRHRRHWHGQPANPIQLGLVIMVDETRKKEFWKKGIIYKLRTEKDGQARSAVVRTVSGLLRRPIVKLAKLDVRHKSDLESASASRVDCKQGMWRRKANWQRPTDRQLTADSVATRAYRKIGNA